ncbi:MAG: DNA polymerase [Candidatus Aenigmatarchaeota archaeon]
MKLEKIKKIKLRFREIKPIKNKFREDFKFFGLDTETYQTIDRVKPFSIQLYSSEYKAFSMIENWSERERIEYFFKICTRLKTNKLILFSFNLQYDISVLFPSILLYNSAHLLPLPIRRKESFRFKLDKYYIRIIYSHPCFLEIAKKNRSKRIRIIFIDLAAFFHSSLEKIAEEFNLPRKLEKPEYLGLRKPTRKELDYFIKYAMQDAKICYYLGKILISWHKKFDIDISRIPTCSPALFSSRIFKKHFLKDTIKLPHKPIVQLALLSYWGGRSECFIYGFVEKCYYYDFNSFYPYALTQIPIPIENKWKFTTKFDGENGFYVITAEIKNQKINPLPVKKERLIFPYGKFKTVVTGYELKEALNENIQIHYGWIYTGRSSSSVKDFVLHFYNLKKNAKNPIEKCFYKLILNSIYGKFIQLKEEKAMGKNLFLAGGLFNPVIASWVTGFCRSKLYSLMKKYEDKVIYCDTDSLITLEPIKEDVGNDLGKLKLEYVGWGIFVREKCYIIKDKFVHHGYIGNKETFMKMILENKTQYTVKRILKFRAAIRRKFPPLFQIYDYRNFDLSSSSKREKCNIPLNYLIFNRKFVWLNPLMHNSTHLSALALQTKNKTNEIRSNRM